MYIYQLQLPLTNVLHVSCYQRARRSRMNWGEGRTLLSPELSTVASVQAIDFVWRREEGKEEIRSRELAEVSCHVLRMATHGECMCRCPNLAWRHWTANGGWRRGFAMSW